MTSLLLKLKNKEHFFIKTGLIFSQKFDVIEKHTPSKICCLRANHKPFIEHEISKTVMKRARLTYWFWKKIIDKNRQMFCEQRTN